MPDGMTSGTACDEARSHSDLAWIQSKVFSASCTFSGCHLGAAANAGHLSLEPGQARSQLINMVSTSDTAWMRVVPGNAANSYLLVAVGSQPGPSPADGIMPLGNPKLCVEKRDAIRRWIEAGAPP